MLQDLAHPKKGTEPPGDPPVSNAWKVPSAPHKYKCRRPEPTRRRGRGEWVASCPQDCRGVQSRGKGAPGRSTIRECPYLIWNSATGPDDTSPTLAGMSVDCWQNTRLHCRQRRGSQKSAYTGPRANSQWEVHLFT